MHFWPKFGNTDFNWWWLFARTSSKWGTFWLLSSIWPWSSRSIVPNNNRDLNQGLFHLWSKFSDSSLNGWWVIARTSWWLTDRHTHTHTHTQATTIPEGQNWPRVIKLNRETDSKFTFMSYKEHLFHISTSVMLWSSGSLRKEYLGVQSKCNIYFVAWKVSTEIV